LIFLLEQTSFEVKITVDEKKLRRLDIERLVGNNNKIKSETGWSPQIPLERTLIDLLNYWREKERASLKD
jgi:GDP-4-dehydro-6-deoxy-D-mannose reductase